MSDAESDADTNDSRAEIDVTHAHVHDLKKMAATETEGLRDYERWLDEAIRRNACDYCNGALYYCDDPRLECDCDAPKEEDEDERHQAETEVCAARQNLEKAKERVRVIRCEINARRFDIVRYMLKNNATFQEIHTYCESDM